VNPDERDTHAYSFGTAAATYDEHRPDYSDAAVRWAISLAPGTRVLDLAAGTGKLTRVLARLGVHVTAVEPDEAMLAELRQNLPEVESLSGAAEDIPLPNGSVDAIVVGQALHWFDMSVAGPEMHRVLVPGGTAAALWNFDDDREPWVAGLEEAAENTGGATYTQWQVGDRAAHFAELSVPGLFSEVDRAEFAHAQRRTAASMTATISTHSRVLMMEPADRERMLSAVSAYLDACPETSGGEFTMPLVTAVLRATRM
jgi:SAM-dependent methyltransferase